MRAEILSIGTELLLGQITDTNATYLAQQLGTLGIDLYFVSQVGDNLDRLTETLERARDRSEFVIMTGGLGPTEDDLSREAIAARAARDAQLSIPPTKRSCEPSLPIAASTCPSAISSRPGYCPR